MVDKVEQEKPFLFVVAGPTASGKTKLGIEMAKRHNGEVISADSMQIYRGMDIGTAKPTVEEQEGIVHHMIDIVEPTEPFSVVEYVEQTSQIIYDIVERGKLPIVVGGTGLYIDSLLKSRPFPPVPENKKLRGELEQEIAQGEESELRMLALLRILDPERGEKLFPRDHKRIVRALEVVLTTGKTQSQYDAESLKVPTSFRAATVALNFLNREDLRERIAQRVDVMLEHGLMDEVKSFMDLPSDCTAMQAIGYKELRGAVTGEQSLEEAVELLKIRSRQYAKRQITWFKNKGDVIWYHWKKNPDFQDALQVSTEILEEFR